MEEVEEALEKSGNFLPFVNKIIFFKLMGQHFN
jgi:hypothetical protein